MKDAMNERRKHKRFPILKDFAEPIEVTLLENHHTRNVPGILTNFSAGGMDMLLMSQIVGTPTIKISMHLPGFDRFSVEGKVAWSKDKGATSLIGLEFTKIDQDHAKQITHMAEAYWECEDRITAKAAAVCFHGCTYWDLCEKPAKLKHLKPAAAGSLG
jgi:hypothetical protein